jgi:GntR family transcriptional regulator
MPFQRSTIYDQIADALRADILAGTYDATADDPSRNELPGAAELGVKYGVSDKTAARAVQQLISDGLVRARPGQRPIAIPTQERVHNWPMHRRYARAREAGGLVFGADMQGLTVTKEVTSTGWTPAPDFVAHLLHIDPGDRVWARARTTLVDTKPAELSVSYFPADIAEGTPLTVPGPFPPGGVVRIIEDAGHRITRTYNEVRSRLATDEELAIFGADPDLAPLAGRIVIEVTHATFGALAEPLEVVRSTRPANGATVAFQTYEGPNPAPQNDPSITDNQP